MKLNAAVEQGTAAHELGEFCIRFGISPVDCIGMMFNKHVVDEAMAEAVALYTGYANELHIKTAVIT